MGAFTSRQRAAAVEEAEQGSHNAYKYPPRSGNFFDSHFIMGGERFDTPQPESYLFGENGDLNFLGNRPTPFPYPPPGANVPTKTLKSLVNIRKESVRFVRATQQEKKPSITVANEANVTTVLDDSTDGNVLSGDVLPPQAGSTAPCSYNIEFTFDSDAKCAITIYYFCNEEISPSGVTLLPRDGLTSETFHYDKGINQYFSQPSHVFNPQLIPEDDFIYNPSKEQYPVAIHCVVEEGNEECRQSHTTICVVDHHPESNSYVLRALKQKIFVDGLCYLLQEIYGIENKAINKSTLDDELDDDHGSECVICMSETRDTLILPCRHLCLCNSCADSLRYQANNCPICRAPFRALLQIRAVQKGVPPQLHQNTANSGSGANAGVEGQQHCDPHLPPGYIPVSLIEALNGPPQYVARSRPLDLDNTDGIATDPLKSGTPTQKAIGAGQKRNKGKKNPLTNQNTIGPNALNEPNIPINNPLALMESGAAEGSNPMEPGKKVAAVVFERRMIHIPTSANEQLRIINERETFKLPSKNKARLGGGLSMQNNGGNNSKVGDVADDYDSENEKLSPLLSPGSRSKSMPSPELNSDSTSAKVNPSNDNDDDDNDNNDNDDDEDIETKKHNNAIDQMDSKSVTSLRKSSSQHGSQSAGVSGGGGDNASLNNENLNVNNEDSDYYTPEDTQNSILSPLCPERSKIVDKLGNLKQQATGSFKGISGSGHLKKKTLHKKSTSVGNIVSGALGGCGPNSGATKSDLKGNVSSLPDMLDSPIAGHSTRSSSDSYSSSSSTKQLLSSNTPSAAAANIIVDDKTSLQNAVNV